MGFNAQCEHQKNERVWSEHLTRRELRSRVLRSGELMSEVLRCGGGEEQETLHHPHQHPILPDID